MQRFNIKIDKSVKARLKNLCRLCGIDNPNQIEILNASEWIDLTIDGEVSLSRKIDECVGIKVMKNDRMPQRICALCVDKIIDFYEFREMCQATNIQTRKLLNIPNPKQPKKVTIQTNDDDDDNVESIFGIVDADIKPKIEPTQKPTKKSKKATATSTVTSANENRFRGMTKREIEITLELERIKKEEEEEQKLQKPEQNRTKNGKKKKGSQKSDGLLLAPKEPNQRERKREIEQKRNEKKRKTDIKIKVPIAKKIKKEPELPCVICGQVFDKISVRDAHLVSTHRPKISDYGCSSCLDSFDTMEETIAHNEWHTMFNVPLKCVLCAASYDKLITFQRHITACVHPSYSEMTSYSPDIFCDICSKNYETQYLYDWHDCFVSQNTPCPKCGKKFNKKMVLMKHFFKCDGICAVPSIEQIPKTTKSKKKKAPPKKKSKSTNIQSNVKLEPETIIETAEEVFDAIDNSYMDTHFGDSDNEYEAEDDSIITPIEPNLSTVTNASESNTQSAPMARKSTTCITSNPSIKTNLIQPLLECRVKLEPLDISSFASTSSVSVNAALAEEVSAPTVPPLVISRPIVPPLTIRIKKEVIQPGYGDEFDPDLARNIKRERVDETWELAGTSTASNEDLQCHKKSKHRDKIKKLYKKPAMLAMKIKQERMDREDTESDYYPDYSMPTENYNENIHSSHENNSLPIITQIHSILEPSTSSSTNIAQPIIHRRQTDTMSLATNSIPFVPIRIKSESITPPPENCVDNDQIDQENSEPSNPSSDVDNVHTSNHPYNVGTIQTTDNAVHQPESQQTESQNTGEASLGLEQNKNTSMNKNDETNFQSSSLTELIHQTEEKCIENSNNELLMENIAKITESISSSTEIIINATVPTDSEDQNSNTYQNEILPQIQPFNDEESSINENLPIGDFLDTSQKAAFENQSDSTNQTPTADDRIDIEMKNDDKNGACLGENSNEMVSMKDDLKIDNNIQQNSIDEIQQFNDDSSSKEIIDDIDQEFIKPISGDEIEDVVTADNMSPIDFNEQNLNDDSLNFIDQLVHEVADTMVQDIQTLDKIDSSNLEFSTTSHQYNVDDHVSVDVKGSIRLDDERDSELVHETNEMVKTETILALTDIPEVNYSDIVPDLSVSVETKSNGNEINTDLPSNENEIATNILTNQPKLSENDINHRSTDTSTLNS